MTLIKAPAVVHHEPIPTIHINHASPNHSTSEQKPVVAMRRTCELISHWLIYATVLAFLGLNAFALLRQGNTIFFLRIYQLIVACIMLVSSGVMIEFMIYANKHLVKLSIPHSIPRPMLISTLMLTIGIVLGYAYFIIFNLTFQNCDTLVDTMDPREVWLDIVYEVVMIWFCILAFVYLMQRSYYGGVHFHSDKMRRLWINATVCIAWIQIVVYKGYLSNQYLCQRKELSGYWCPVVKSNYTCDVSKLKGTRQIWYYLNKGLLNTSIIACASEFFPVVLVAHWLVCGGAEERAEDLIRKQRQKKSVRRVLHRFMQDISRIYGAAKHKHVSLPPLRTSSALRYLLNSVATISIFVVIGHWLVKFYYTILFDKLSMEGWLVDDFTQFSNGIVQVFFHLLIYFWATRIEKRRFDAYHKAEARGDVVIVFGCCILLSVKSVLQFVELDFQQKDQNLTTLPCILKIIIVSTTIGAQWLQFLSLRRILALSDRDVNASKSFLPVIAIAAFIANCVNFGATFFDTTIIKYQIAHEEDYGFSAVTLISMIITQTMYPADYLYAFTAAGCWMDLIYRFSKMGYFQLGLPSLDQLEFDNHSILSGTISRRSTHIEKRLSLPTISVHEAL